MTSKFRVFMYEQSFGEVVVEADSAEEAQELAYDLDDSLITWTDTECGPSIDLEPEELGDDPS